MQAIANKSHSVYVVHNKFKIKPHKCANFENIWAKRRSYVNQMPGFVSFTFLKNTQEEGEYISQTVWKSEDHFTQWRKSPQFMFSHVKAMITFRDFMDEMPEVSYFDGSMEI